MLFPVQRSGLFVARSFFLSSLSLFTHLLWLDVREHTVLSFSFFLLLLNPINRVCNASKPLEAAVE